MSELDFSDRYGQKPMRWKSLAVFLLICGGAWLMWAGLHHSRPAISATLISFSTTSDRSISLRYSIDRRNPAGAITCTLTALDFDKNVVGEIDDLIVAGGSHVEKTTHIPTRSAAVNAGISRCRPSSQ
jgi:hypothetical protein